MHINELKKLNPKAFQAYVDMLVEDCQDEFEVSDDGTLTVRVMIDAGDDDSGLGIEESHRLKWVGDDPERSATSDIGDGWETQS